MRLLTAIGLVMMACLGTTQAQRPAAAASGIRAKTREVASRQLQVPRGARVRMTLLEVTYPPGGASAPHSHPCPVVGYVVSGVVRMKVKGGAEQIYKAGTSFYEAPNGIHEISANASNKNPATFLALFLCDNDLPLSSPVETGGPR